MALPSPQLSAYPAPDLAAMPGAAPYAMLLRSMPGHALGRRSLLARDPFQVAVVRGRRVRVHTAAGASELTGDPWAIISQLMAPFRQSPDPRHPCPGGVLGYVGYDFGRPAAALQQLNGKTSAKVKVGEVLRLSAP